MQDPLLSWSYILFCIGLLALLIFFNLYTPDEILIENLPDLEQNEHFQISASVKSITNSKKVAYFKVIQNCSADLMLFKKKPINYSLNSITRINGQGHVIEKGVYVLDSFKLR